MSSRSRLALTVKEATERYLRRPYLSWLLFVLRLLHDSSNSLLNHYYRQYREWSGLPHREQLREIALPTVGMMAMYRRQLLKDYINGLSIEELTEKYGLTRGRIHDIIRRGVDDKCRYE